MKDFFLHHIAIIKNNNYKCSECGANLMGDFSEVAHILPKSRFKSVAMDDENIIYLCGWMSQNNCHGTYDNCSNEYVRGMKIFPTVSEYFQKFVEDYEEKLTYKDYDRWQA